MSYDITILFAPLARTFGFFLISPLFSSSAIPQGVRIGLALFVAVLLSPFAPPPPLLNLSTLIFFLIKEVAVGYLLGIAFALLFEGAKLAGEMLGTMTGFSTSELFDPHSMSPALFGRLFYLTALALFLCFDMHHYLLYLLKESFSLTYFSFNSETLQILLKGTTLLLSQALDYAFPAFLALFLLFILFAFFAKLFPDLPLFFIAFPLQIIIGIVIVALSLPQFAPILKKGFFEIVFQILGKQE